MRGVILNSADANCVDRISTFGRTLTCIGRGVWAFGRNICAIRVTRTRSRQCTSGWMVLRALDKSRYTWSFFGFKTGTTAYRQKSVVTEEFGKYLICRDRRVPVIDRKANMCIWLCPLYSCVFLAFPMVDGLLRWLRVAN